MVPEMLEEACRQHQPRLVYLTPTLQNPTAITIPERRRKEFASIAKRCNVRIVEDDPTWLLADAPPPPIATFASEQVYYISTLSKCLTPGLRVAFVFVRNPHERECFLVAPRSFALMVAPLAAALATQWILGGTADGLKAYATRRVCATGWFGIFWRGGTAAPETACMYGSSCRRIRIPRSLRGQPTARASQSPRRRHSQPAADP